MKIETEPFAEWETWEVAEDPVCKHCGATASEGHKSECLNPWQIARRLFATYVSDHDPNLTQIVQVFVNPSHLVEAIARAISKGRERDRDAGTGQNDSSEE
jgi:hypothetical protein